MQTTVKQFKETYGLSDEMFRRYRVEAEKANPEKEIVVRQGSRTWVISDLQALETVLPDEVKARKYGQPLEVEFVEDAAEIAPVSSAIVISESRNVASLAPVQPVQLHQTRTDLTLVNQQTSQTMSDLRTVAGFVFKGIATELGDDFELALNAELQGRAAKVMGKIAGFQDGEQPQ